MHSQDIACLHNNQVYCNVWTSHEDKRVATLHIWWSWCSIRGGAPEDKDFVAVDHPDKHTETTTIDMHWMDGTCHR